MTKSCQTCRYSEGGIDRMTHKPIIACTFGDYVKLAPGTCDKWERCAGCDEVEE